MEESLSCLTSEKILELKGGRGVVFKVKQAEDKNQSTFSDFKARGNFYFLTAPSEWLSDS